MPVFSREWYQYPSRKRATGLMSHTEQSTVSVIVFSFKIISFGATIHIQQNGKTSGERQRRDLLERALLGKRPNSMVLASHFRASL